MSVNHQEEWERGRAFRAGWESWTPPPVLTPEQEREAWAVTLGLVGIVLALLVICWHLLGGNSTSETVPPSTPTWKMEADKRQQEQAEKEQRIEEEVRRESEERWKREDEEKRRIREEEDRKFLEWKKKDDERRRIEEEESDRRRRAGLLPKLSLGNFKMPRDQWEKLPESEKRFFDPVD
jgi:hypothetical protein